MQHQLRLLHLEDSQVDADLVATMLRDGGIPCESLRVDTRASFLNALRKGGFDLIFADFSVPAFDGAAALALAHKLCPDVPFIFVSGTLVEEFAIEMMHRGATDYIFKQRLGRLVPSVQRTLRELDERAERKRAEEALRLSEQQFRQAQKMEAVGRLAGGLAHDFNNLLTVIMGHSQVLLGELPAASVERAKIEEMHKAGERAAALIRQLLAFSRKQALEPKVLCLNTVVTNLDSMLSRLIGEDIQLAIRVDPEKGHVKADPGQLEQVIMNLVINARDAMPNGGLLAIETSQVQLTRTPMHHIRPLPPGPYMKLTVTDTGCGMTQNTLSHLFEPFFTTKEECKGTGLGLSTVFGIVTKSGGAIDVWSQVGHGTTFDIYLPRINPEAGVLSPHVKPAAIGRGNETILVVEDEQSVRDLVREELTKIGYQVVEAMNGIEACLVATQHGGQFDLLLTDIVMPGMNGRELAGRLHLIYPDLKVLFMSGYLDDVTANAGLEQNQTAFLQKPFTPDVLARSIRELLNAPTRAASVNGAPPLRYAADQKSS